MQESFINRICREIKTQFGSSTADLCLVFPNRRPSLFLQKELSKHYDEPIWLPDTYSIQDFINLQHENAVLDPIMLEFELYEVYRNMMGDKAQSFQEFMDWAPTLLSDFDEIDAYLIDPEKIFENLSEFKYFSIWEPGKLELSKMEADYLKFFQSLKRIYEGFREHLLSKSYVYQGLANRLVIENFDTYFTQNKYKQIWFVGFNALSTSESELIKRLKAKGIAKTYWDADKYYLDSKIQEAGHFLRKEKENEKKDFNWVFDNFSNPNRKDQIIGAAGNVRQIKTAAEIIQKIALTEPEKLEKTAIIMNNEEIALPLLNSIPAEIKHFNITMGFSLKNTPIYIFLRSLFEMQENILRYSRGKNIILHYKDIKKLLQLPLIVSYHRALQKDIQVNTILQRIQKQNRVFFTLQQLQDLLGGELQETLDFFLPWMNNANTALQSIETSLKKIKDKLYQDKGNELNREYLSQFIKIFVRISDLSKEYRFEVEISNLKRYFIQISTSTRIPFSGEPISGLQIMGLLESRLLDFDYVIMLSTNENIIPKGKAENSFFLHELRKHFGLPTYRSNTSIFAYHFYRAIQRAKKTYLIYNTEMDDFGSNEQSRFLMQLKNELPPYNGNKIEETIINPPPEDLKTKLKISIPKDQNALNKLGKIAAKGFSSTALNVYLNCPLQFYFQYIAGLKEEEEVEETIEARTSGTIIHDVMESLYKPLTNKVLIPNDFDRLVQEYIPLTQEYYKKHYPEGDIKTGKNRLIYETSLLLIKKLLKAEKEVSRNKELIILGTETNFEVPFPNSPEKANIKLRGQIDRIDSLDSLLRIIDYKTGRVDQKDLNFTEIQDLKEGKFPKVFQTIFYTYAINLKKRIPKEVQMGIISFKNIPKDIILPLTLKSGRSKQTNFQFGEDLAQDFEDLLTELFEEIFETERPFKQTENLDHCKYCNYAGICGK